MLAEGLIPTTAGDVIVRAVNSNIANDELQRELARKVGDIVVDTMPLRHGDRQADIARPVTMRCRPRAGLPPSIRGSPLQACVP